MNTYWLYVKQHNKTKLKYFGKTDSNDPYSYRGSGKYWRKHLKKHGKEISTIILWLFDTKEERIEFALWFSENFDIVNSQEWANLTEEDGKTGGNTGSTPNMKGFVWMNNGKRSIRVNSENATNRLEDGFVFGRISFTRVKTKYMHRDDKTVRVKESDIAQFILEGYLPGRSDVLIEKSRETGRRNIRKVNMISGKRWYNDGVKEKYILPNDAPVGFVRGRLPMSPPFGKLR